MAKLSAKVLRGMARPLAPKRSSGVKKARRSSGGKRQPRPFQAVGCRTGTLIQGGCLKKPVYMPTVDFDGEVFVKLHPREPWLCAIVAGKATGLDPLKRTCAVQVLRLALDEAFQRECALLRLPGSTAPAGNIDNGDAMHGFGLDTIEGLPLPSVPARERKEGKKKKVVLPPPSRIIVPLPSVLRGAGRESVRALSRPPSGTLVGGRCLCTWMKSLGWSRSCTSS